ncbi:MAG TPA: ATP-binding cassette domain-containing protein [Pirellulales bacterium]|nr:ATP-binding cassette domain-containing protein [Pirellulales bacterium]
MLPAVEVERLVHHYGQRCALDHLSLCIEQGELFAILGPNGGGKTTLFRLLSTLIPVQQGSIRILGHDAATAAAQVRARLGVVFQAASLDRKLTVLENLLYQGPLYGLGGLELRRRAGEMLERLRLADRQRDLVETLSGGLRRRVELAKGLLHRPPLLLLDEPSTGLDPGARSDLWSYLRQIRDQDGVTVVLTTHLLEEADKVDRLAILNQGSLVALDTPDNLRATVGGDSITIDAAEPAALAGEVSERFGCAAKIVEGKVRLEQPDGHRLIARLIEAFPGRVQSITLGKPTLEDVFIDRTGHRFWTEANEAAKEPAAKPGRRAKAGRP